MKPCEHEVERVGTETNLLINCIGCEHYPSIEDNEACMRGVVEKIIGTGSVTTVTLRAERNYVYPIEQTSLLNEVASLYVDLVKRRKILSDPFFSECRHKIPEAFNTVALLLERIKGDPIGAYVSCVRRIREYEVKEIDEGCKRRFISLLKEIKQGLERTKMIAAVKDKLAGYKVGDRTIYRQIFEPYIRPNFMYTRLLLRIPADAKVVDSYQIKDARVTIFKVPGKTRLVYHIVPIELQLSEEEYALLDEAREILAGYKPKKEEFVDPERIRTVFYNIGRDLLEELCKRKGIEISYDRIVELAKILVRLTVGFGIVEVLLNDPCIEDIYLNAPAGRQPVFVKHSEFGECETNILVSVKDVDAWVSRFRLFSGRPLDEANPVLDTELITESERARVCIIQRPLSPAGYSFAFRHHRGKPWTLPLFIHVKYLTPLAAGLLSFLVDGARTMLIAGTRGAGKTSLLGALMVEILRKYRIITVEDTLELPVAYLRKIGYNIVSMKVRSAIVGEATEMSAEDGIRTSLRLGDSCLIIGEVRSTEARALYEAMRVGALANVVAGTIHGENPYGVFDRVVNDLSVPRTSFKATDVIVVANKLRSPDLLREYRRIVQITEVRKHWQNDPLAERGFVDLMKYDAANDELKPTRDLMEGESEVLKAIAGRVREWAGKWDRVWDNILLRAQQKKMLVDYARHFNRFDILEADFVVQANDVFHRIFERQKEEFGYPESKEVLAEFENWLRQRLKKYG